MTRQTGLHAAGQEQLEAARCDACGHVFLPRGPVCLRCWSDQLGRQALSGLGEVATFTVYRHQYHPDFPPPYVIAVVALREGPRMVSNIVDCAPEAVRVRMPVRVRHRLRGGRVLPVFAPAADVAGIPVVTPGASP